MRASIARNVRFVGLIALLASAVACSTDALPGSQDPTDASAADGSPDADVAAAQPNKQLALGAVPTHTDGKSSTIEFDLPPGAVAFTITLTGDPSTYATLAELRLPGGLTIIPAGWLSLSDSAMACYALCSNRILAQPGQAAFLFPNTPLVAVKPGRVTFRAYTFTRTSAGKEVAAAAELQARVDIVTARDLTVDHGVLINLGLTGADSLTAKTALQQPRIKQALQSVRAIYQKAGVAMAFRAFDALDQQLIATRTGPDAHLTRLFASGGTQPLGINVFLVDKVLSQQPAGPGENILAGLSGGVPGAPLTVGGPRAGIALSLHLQPGQQDTLGATMAHEIGHFLGLFHTVEAAVGGSEPLRDNLPDTDDGTANLMHWTVAAGATELTSDQTKVLFNSAWVQPVL